MFSSARFSVKPVDIPAFLCCCNANLSAPLKRGRQEEEEGGTQRITALRINTTQCKQRKTQKKNMCTICNYTLFRLTEGETQTEGSNSAICVSAGVRVCVRACVRVCFSPVSQICTERERGGKRDRQIVLHLQYVSELVAMQQDWESVEVGGW